MKKKIIIFLVIFISIILFCLYYFQNKSAIDNPSKETSINQCEEKPIVNKTIIEETSKDTNIKDNMNFEGYELKDNSEGVPVLYYHSIQKSGTNELMMDPNKFKSHLQWLKDNNYVTLTLNQLHDHLTNNTPVPKNSVVITLDDGYIDNYINALPIINEFGFNATIFMVSDFTGNENFLTEETLRELDKNNIKVESHTSNHLNLPTLDKENQNREILNSKKSLEEILNRNVDYIAYPYGAYNEDTKNLAKEAGYKLGFSTDSGWANGNSPSYAIPRVYMSDFYDLDEFINRVTNPNYE